MSSTKARSSKSRAFTEQRRMCSTSRELQYNEGVAVRAEHFQYNKAFTVQQRMCSTMGEVW